MPKRLSLTMKDLNNLHLACQRGEITGDELELIARDPRGGPLAQHFKHARIILRGEGDIRVVKDFPPSPEQPDEYEDRLIWRLREKLMQARYTEREFTKLIRSNCTRLLRGLITGSYEYISGAPQFDWRECRINELQKMYESSLPEVTHHTPNEPIQWHPELFKTLPVTQLPKMEGWNIYSSQDMDGSVANNKVRKLLTHRGESIANVTALNDLLTRLWLLPESWIAFMQLQKGKMFFGGTVFDSQRSISLSIHNKQIYTHFYKQNDMIQNPKFRIIYFNPDIRRKNKTYRPSYDRS